MGLTNRCADRKIAEAVGRMWRTGWQYPLPPTLWLFHFHCLSEGMVPAGIAPRTRRRMATDHAELIALHKRLGRKQKARLMAALHQKARTVARRANGGGSQSSGGAA